MTAAAEALLARVYGYSTPKPLPAALVTARLLKKEARSESHNLGVPRPMLGLAENRTQEPPEWRGN